MTADYRDTVLMPRTAFPMKARLPEREPAMVARWEEIGLYWRFSGRTRPGGPSSCFTTARPMPTVTFTWARR